jgi:hypothetical protein
MEGSILWQLRGYAFIYKIALKRAMAMETTRVMARTTRVAGNKEGNGKGGKSDGNGDGEGNGEGNNTGDGDGNEGE